MASAGVPPFACVVFLPWCLAMAFAIIATPNKGRVFSAVLSEKGSIYRGLHGQLQKYFGSRLLRAFQQIGLEASSCNT